MAITSQRILDANKKWREKNHDYYVQKKREHYYANRENIRRKIKEKRDANKDLVNEQVRIDRIANKPRWDEGWHRRAARPKTRLKSIARACYYRALEKGIAQDKVFLLSLAENPPNNCACCGCDLDYSSGRGRGNRKKSASMDRFDNSKGYVAGNVFIVCFNCNDLKGQATVDDLEIVLAYMRGESPAIRLVSGGALK